MYYTYMLRCEDSSIYTGMTNNIDRRICAHKNKTGAKYTKSHKPIKLEIAWSSKDKSLACKLEAYIKQLSKKEKENLIIDKKLVKYLKGKVDCRRYRYVNINYRSINL